LVGSNFTCPVTRRIKGSSILTLLKEVASIVQVFPATIQFRLQIIDWGSKKHAIKDAREKIVRWAGQARSEGKEVKSGMGDGL